MYKLGSIIGYSMLFFGVTRVLLSFWVASISDPEAYQAALSEYLVSSSIGEAMDKGVYSIYYALILIILSTTLKYVKKIYAKL